MKPEKYRDFLISRVIESHDYASNDILLAEIEKLNALDKNTDPKWKVKLREMERKIVHREGTYHCLTFSDLPAFLAQEMNAMRLFKQRTEKKRGPRNG